MGKLCPAGYIQPVMLSKWPTEFYEENKFIFRIVKWKN